MITFPKQSLRQRARADIRHSRMASLQAEINLLRMNRVFETPEQLHNRQTLEALRSTDVAVKPFLRHQRTK